MVFVMLLTFSVPFSFAEEKKGGILPCFVACCLGPRIGLEMNEGRDIRLLEWLTLVPIVGIVTKLMMVFEAYQGKTMSEIAAEENL